MLLSHESCCGRTSGRDQGLLAGSARAAFGNQDLMGLSEKREIATSDIPDTIERSRSI